MFSINKTDVKKEFNSILTKKKMMDYFSIVLTLIIIMFSMKLVSDYKPHYPILIIVSGILCIASVVYSQKIWKCPDCNTYLGYTIGSDSIKKCPNCNIKLK